MANRVAYYTNESFLEDSPIGMVYMVAMVTENEAGYTPVPGLAASQLATAQDRCKMVNQRNNRSERDVLDIVASSMAVSKID